VIHTTQTWGNRAAAVHRWLPGFFSLTHSRAGSVAAQTPQCALRAFLLHQRHTPAAPRWTPRIRTAAAVLTGLPPGPASPAATACAAPYRAAARTCLASGAIYARALVGCRPHLPGDPRQHPPPISSCHRWTQRCFAAHVHRGGPVKPPSARGRLRNPSHLRAPRVRPHMLHRPGRIPAPRDTAQAASARTERYKKQKL